MAAARAVKNVFIVAAKRTPYGVSGGKLSKLTATDLAELASKCAIQENKIDPKIINSCYFGMVYQSSADAAYLSRHVGLRVGAPVTIPSMTLNRLCGSGFSAIIHGTQDIELGLADVVLCGGAESMSLVPYAVTNIRYGGLPLGQDIVLEDWLWKLLTDRHINTPMGVTAENLATKYKISREECDQFAIRSQQLWKKAHDAGKFKSEIAPIKLKSKKGEEIMDMDEPPRPETALEKIAKLPTIFKKDGTVTAANASGIADGAGAVIVASEAACKKYNLKPLVRVVGYSMAGCDPRIMGIGPVPAIQKLMPTVGVKLEDVDYIEVNEAFAAQSISVIKELNLDIDKVNMHGGAIALGHPVGASGSRITAHLSYLLPTSGKRYGLASACIGGGQGVALLLERC